MAKIVFGSLLYNLLSSASHIKIIKMNASEIALEVWTAEYGVCLLA